MEENRFIAFVHQVRNALGKSLPGWEAQVKMAHHSRKSIPEEVSIPEDASLAGILILLYPVNGCINIVFMKRSEYDGVHSGQISFPGGKMETEDLDVQETALREASEEIGINRAKTIVIGSITDLYIPPSNFRVTPTIAYTLETPRFIPDPEEVAEIIEINLPELLREETIQLKNIRVGAGFNITVPCFFIEGHIIWGATAMILSEFLEVLRKDAINADCKPFTGSNQDRIFIS